MTEVKGLSATMRRVTSWSKKRRSAVSAWLFVDAEPIYRAARPGVIWRSSTPDCSHQARNRVTQRT